MKNLEIIKKLIAKIDIIDIILFTILAVLLVLWNLGTYAILISILIGMMLSFSIIVYDVKTIKNEKG